MTGLTGPEVVDGVQAARELLAEFGPGSPFQVSAQDGKARSCGRGRAEADAEPNEGTLTEDVTKVPGAADALPFPAVLPAGEPAALTEATEVTRLVVVDGPSQHGPTRMIAGLGLR
ncbi:MAG TPA: hypothetical protein VIV12_05480 [Streptosporangiaceae bacterium]